MWQKCKNSKIVILFQYFSFSEFFASGIWAQSRFPTIKKGFSFASFSWCIPPLSLFFITFIRFEPYSHVCKVTPSSHYFFAILKGRNKTKQCSKKDGKNEEISWSKNKQKLQSYKNQLRAIIFKLPPWIFSKRIIF